MPGTQIFTSAHYNTSYGLLNRYFSGSTLRKVLTNVFSHLNSFKDKLYVHCSLKSDVVHHKIKGFVFIHSIKQLMKPKQILLITAEVVIIIIIIISIMKIMSNYQG